MIEQLTSSERQNAAIILLALAVAGVAFAILGRSDTLGVHGVIIMLFAGGRKKLRK